MKRKYFLVVSILVIVLAMAACCLGTDSAFEMDATLTPIPTGTISILPTSTLAPTETRHMLVPVATFTPAGTLTPVFTCDCSGDTYDCHEFLNHAQAQECHDYCRLLGLNDVHRLDQDNDGVACESLQ